MRVSAIKLKYPKNNTCYTRHTSYVHMSHTNTPQSNWSLRIVSYLTFTRLTFTSIETRPVATTRPSVAYYVSHRPVERGPPIWHSVIWDNPSRNLSGRVLQGYPTVRIRLGLWPTVPTVSDCCSTRMKKGSCDTMDIRDNSVHNPLLPLRTGVDKSLEEAEVDKGWGRDSKPLGRGYRTRYMNLNWYCLCALFLFIPL